MTNDDVAFGLALSRGTGWNQLDVDWRRVVALEPSGCFVGLLDGQDAGTVATCRFGDSGWVQLLLVHEAARGRGVGQMLLRRALDYLTNCGVRSIRLDATPLGQPLYERLGFRADFELVRFGGIVANQPATTNLSSRMPIVPLSETSLTALIERDHLVTGTNRADFLRHLSAEWPEAGRVALDEHGAVAAYCLARRGYLATQLGPCGGGAAAGDLLAAALAERVGESVFVDVPVAHFESVRIVTAAGLTPRRTLLRMTLGPAVAERPELLWASSGPEKG